MFFSHPRVKILCVLMGLNSSSHPLVYECVCLHAAFHCVCLIVQAFSSFCLCAFCVCVSISPIASPPGEVSCSACRRISRWSWRLDRYGEGGRRQWWLCLGEGSSHSPGPQRWLSACCHLECEYSTFFSTQISLILLWWWGPLVKGHVPHSCDLDDNCLGRVEWHLLIVLK